MALAREIRWPQPTRCSGRQGALQPDPVRGWRVSSRRSAVIGMLIATPNQVEAVMANFEKRPPVFTDPTT